MHSSFENYLLTRVSEANVAPHYPCSLLGRGEYATILISIPDRLMPKNLQGTDHFWKGHGVLETVSVSLTGRLTNKQIMIESKELAERFSVYLKGKFQGRPYGDECKIKVTIVSDTKYKTIARKKLKHTQLIRSEMDI